MNLPSSSGMSKAADGCASQGGRGKPGRDVQFEVSRTLREYWHRLGESPEPGSFLGAMTLRRCAHRHEDRLAGVNDAAKRAVQKGVIPAPFARLPHTNHLSINSF